MNILITGVHGFVGNNLVSALKNKHTIYGLDIVKPSKEGINRTYGWDELDKIPQVEVMIHLAGKAHDTKKQTEAKAYFEINTGLTKKIFDWFQTSTAKKFIFFSSVKAAAESTEGKILTEEIIPNPKGPYGESKLAAEKYIIEHLSANKLVYILRPCMIHGSGNKGNLNLLYKIQQNGLPWPLGAFENKRSVCSVYNILFVVQQLIDKNIVSGVYQVADDEALSTNELIRLMASTRNKEARIWKMPAKLVTIIARIGDLFHFPLNSERLRKLTESYVVSNQKIKNAIGVKQMPESAVKGLTKTFTLFET